MIVLFDLDGTLLDHDRADREAALSLRAPVAPCLDALSNWRLGVIANGDGAVQRAKVEALGLGARFEHVLVSGACGFAKPDRVIFRLACDAFGVAPNDALYVGDDFSVDFLGAQGAGLHALRLNRGAGGDGLSSLEHLPARLNSALA